MGNKVVTPAMIVLLDLPPKGKNAALSGYAKLVAGKLPGNTLVANPNPSATDLGTAITNYDASELALKNGTGTVGDRDIKRGTLVQTLRHLANFAQGLCEQAPESAAAIAQSIGMKLKKSTGRAKAPFAVKPGATSGSAVLVAKAAKRPSTYYWSFSLDGKNWVSVPDTHVANTTISGLTPGQTYYFRYCTLTKSVKSDFSQVLSLLVT